MKSANDRRWPRHAVALRSRTRRAGCFGTVILGLLSESVLSSEYSSAFWMARAPAEIPRLWARALGALFGRSSEAELSSELRRRRGRLAGGLRQRTARERRMLSRAGRERRLSVSDETRQRTDRTRSARGAVRLPTPDAPIIAMPSIGCEVSRCRTRFSTESRTSSRTRPAAGTARSFRTRRGSSSRSSLIELTWAAALWVLDREDLDWRRGVLPQEGHRDGLLLCDSPERRIVDSRCPQQLHRASEPPRRASPSSRHPAFSPRGSISPRRCSSHSACSAS